MKMGIFLRFLALLVFISSGAAFAGNDDLVIYSGRSDKFIKPAVDAFTHETGIKVILHSANSTALLNKLRIEGTRTQADLYVSNDAGNLQLGSNLGLFETIGFLFDQIQKLFSPGHQRIQLASRLTVNRLRSRLNDLAEATYHMSVNRIGLCVKANSLSVWEVEKRAVHQNLWVGVGSGRSPSVW